MKNSLIIFKKEIKEVLKTRISGFPYSSSLSYFQ